MPLSNLRPQPCLHSRARPSSALCARQHFMRGALPFWWRSRRPTRQQTDAPRDGDCNQRRQRDNNFHAGDFTIEARGIQVAGCLLDKVVAITVENGIEEFANDLLVDLAACCTRGPDGCVASLAESYLAIGALGKLDGFSSTKRTKPLVVADLVNYARALSIDAPEELLPTGQKLLARCRAARRMLARGGGGALQAAIRDRDREL